MSTFRKVLAVATTTAVTGGALFMGATGASAANDPDFKKVKAPKSVMAGETFLIKCQMKKTVDWSGSDAFLLEKGASVNARRSMGANGNCSMHVVLYATGKRKVRVVVEKNLGAEQSRWITINVKSAS